MEKVREILFRAKAINRDPNREYRTNYKNGDWVYGLLTEKPYESSFGISPAHMTNEEGISGIDVDFDTLGQYMGMEDLEGNKIFEGDIFVPLYFPPCTTIEKAIQLHEFDNDEMGVVTFEYGNTILKKKYKRDKELSNYIEREFSHYQSNVGEIYKYKNNIALGKVIGNIYDNPELVR
jgi:uncharacterized phage protein (TIGR01671 family)